MKKYQVKCVPQLGTVKKETDLSKDSEQIDSKWETVYLKVKETVKM